MQDKNDYKVFMINSLLLDKRLSGILEKQEKLEIKKEGLSAL